MLRVIQFISLIIFVATTPVLCVDLNLAIQSELSTIPPGVPFVFNLILSSNENFVLPEEFGMCDGHTQIVVLDQSGNLAEFKQEVPCPYIEKSTMDSFAKRSYSGSTESKFEIFMYPGTYSVKAVYRSIGPYIDRYSDTDLRQVEDIWIGEIHSNWISITVQFPQGEDQQALITLGPMPGAPLRDYVWFTKEKAEEILLKYPRSYYSAWILWRGAREAYSSFEFVPIEQDISYSMYLLELKNNKDMHTYAQFKKELEELNSLWERLYEYFPTFPYRRAVMLGHARTLIRLGMHEKAAAIIEELTRKFPKSKEAKTAFLYKAALNIQNKR